MEEPTREDVLRALSEKRRKRREKAAEIVTGYVQSAHATLEEVLFRGTDRLSDASFRKLCGAVADLELARRIQLEPSRVGDVEEEPEPEEPAVQYKCRACGGWCDKRHENYHSYKCRSCGRDNDQMGVLTVETETVELSTAVMVPFVCTRCGGRRCRSDGNGTHCLTCGTVT